MDSSSGIFDVIPIEIIRIIFAFCDIPSLGNIAQMGRSPLAECASDDCTWAPLVERRFRLATKKSSPRLHGGQTWKHAYSSMAISDRIPKAGRYTSSQKIVFAKGRSARRKVQNESVSLWVLLGHTENCKTRTVQPSQLDEESINERNNERYVELHLCMQNVKSGDGDVTVDVLDSTLVLMGNSGSYEPLITHVQSTGMSLRPKVLFHDSMEETEFYDVSKGVKLRPFDVVVVSVHFPCATDVFETDFLARAVSLHVPVRKVGKALSETSKATVVASPCANMQRQVQPCSRNTLTTLVPPHASAFFVPETTVWNYYTELPGGFLTLVDRFQMLTV